MRIHDTAQPYMAETEAGYDPIVIEICPSRPMLFSQRNH